MQIKLETIGLRNNRWINEQTKSAFLISVNIQPEEIQTDTLLIVTADHETGGLGISSGNIKTFTPSGGFVTSGHTAAMVPVFAMGVGAEQFSGIYENTAIFDKMLKVLNKTP